MLLFFFFNDTATTEIYTLSLHDALPIFQNMDLDCAISKADTEELGFEFLETLFILHYLLPFRGNLLLDRKSTRLNSSHANISYAVFCLKKKKTTHKIHMLTLIILFNMTE